MDILVVDDNNEYRDTLVRYFKSKGFRTEGAIDGADGLARYRKRSHRVVLLDLMMPGMGGEEMLYEMSKWDELPVVIVMTVSSREDEYRYQLYEKGCFYYEEKPIDVQETAWKIRNLIQIQKRDGRSVQGAGSQMNREIQEFYEYVLDQIGQEEMNVAEIARKMGVGRRALDSMAREFLSGTMHDVIRNVRLLKAREICREGGAGNVKELAGMVGYRDAGYFSRLYREAFGSSVVEDLKSGVRLPAFGELRGRM